MSQNGVPRILKFLRAINSGMTQEQVAERLSVSASLIAKFETARLVPMPDTARQLDNLFGSGDLVQGTAADARKAAPPEWFRPWPDIEREATAIRWHESAIIPGLLQTEAYAREILTSGLLTEAQAEEHVSLRLERQAAVFGREDPPVCQFTIDQNALGERGDRAVLKEQLHHLVEMGDRSRLFVHVIPHSAEHYPGENGPFMLASLPNETTVGYVDDQVEGRLITEPGRVAALERSWQAVTAVALPRGQSRALIMKLVNEL
ncbi:Scr1 family TA system antitoxin-like transcriptional regulator [Plantactinospora sp. B6F1]|uniref:helix-turn-helix domain-containing protein n=1 Tax=Plantactinospora sp. B6F1 TaxID=3158971 RepID=UPI0032D97600